MSGKKLLIGIPGYNGIMPECQENIIGMIYRTVKETDLQIGIKVVVKREQWRARNTLVTAALAGRFDYLLMLDDDMLVPHNLITSLLAHDKDVVGGLYYQRGGHYRPVIMDLIENEYGEINSRFWQAYDDRIVNDRGLHQVDIIGGGCMLFKTHVFEKMNHPIFQWEREAGTDVAICYQLKQSGFKVYCDTSIELGHVGDRQVITSRTVPMNGRIIRETTEILGTDLQMYYDMPVEWILEQLEYSVSEHLRKDNGSMIDGTWDSIKTYYKSNPDWHIFNIAAFNMWNTDEYTMWALNTGLKLMGESGGAFLDYGPGVGYVTIPMAKVAKTYAVEVEDASTLQFLEYRKVAHQLTQLDIMTTDTPVPTFDLPEKVAGASIISVLNHLTDPYDTMRWIARQMRPGAFLICDWALYSDHHDGAEPQHIDAYDPSTFRPFLFSLGFVGVPEKMWLFTYEGAEDAL